MCLHSSREIEHVACTRRPSRPVRRRPSRKPRLQSCCRCRAHILLMLSVSQRSSIAVDKPRGVYVGQKKASRRRCFGRIGHDHLLASPVLPRVADLHLCWPSTICDLPRKEREGESAKRSIITDVVKYQELRWQQHKRSLRSE
jgi:hypothetical protein